MKVPEKYSSYYYFRDFDLHPEKLGECCPYNLSEEQCESFLDQGFLFRSREEAEHARNVMLYAYRKTSRTSSIHSSQCMSSKGILTSTPAFENTNCDTLSLNSVQESSPCSISTASPEGKTTSLEEMIEEWERFCDEDIARRATRC